MLHIFYRSKFNSARKGDHTNMSKYSYEVVWLHMDGKKTIEVFKSLDAARRRERILLRDPKVREAFVVCLPDLMNSTERLVMDFTSMRG
jgi:hypothetical protein